MKILPCLFSRQQQSPSATLQHAVLVVLVLALALLHSVPAFAGNLVINASGGTLALGSGFSLTGATATSPAGTVSFDCPITSTTNGGTTITYYCSGGSYTFQSNDGTTTVSASFTASTVVETIYVGSHGHPTTYGYKFTGNLSGTETVNAVSAAIVGESTLSISGLTTQLGSATAGSSATGINWQYSPVYIADYSFSRILFTDDIYGTNELTFGSTGTGVNQFYGTSGIALDSSGRIYVGDMYNARVVRIDDMTGKNWTTFGTYGSGAKQFSYQTAAVAVDAQNRIYVMDLGNGRIDRFDDMTGTNWTTFGTPGTGVNQFEGASGIAFDPAGNIYIADTGNGRIVEMADMNGTNWTTLSPVGSVTKVAIDPQNRIIYGTNNSVSSTITRVDNISGANPVTLSIVNGAIAVNGLQVAADGTTYVATQYGGEVMFDDIITGAGFITTNFVSQPSGIVPMPVPNPVPAVKLSGTSLTFAAQNIGTVSPSQSVTLTNFGSAPLDLTITVSKDFQVSTTCPSALAGGSNCTISVSYAPTVTGAETGAVTLTDNAFTGTQTISLSGTGTAPVASIAPAALNFEPQLLNTTSSAQAVVLTNSGTGALTFSGTGISTTGDFSQTNNCGSALAFGTSCQINVTYKPTVVGTESGSLSVTSNSPTLTVALAGTGSSTTPSTSVSPESLVFSPQLIKTKSASQSVVLTNTSTKTITVISTSITGDFSKTGTCTSISAGKSCTFKVYFTPTAGGSRSGTLTFTLSTGTVSVALTGTGETTATGWLSISPTSLDFNGYTVGDNPSMNLTVTNTTGVFTGISKITKTGSTTFTQTNNCGSGLAAYATCTITVTFTPTAVGTFTGTLTVTEAAGDAHKISLTGTAVSGGM